MVAIPTPIDSPDEGGILNNTSAMDGWMLPGAYVSKPTQNGLTEPYSLGNRMTAGPTMAYFKLNARS